MPIFLLIIAIGLVIWVFVVVAQKAAERERQRKAALSAWASSNRLRWDENDPFGLDSRFDGVGDIGRGHSRYAQEVISGSVPLPLWLFRYHFCTTETRTVTRDGRSYTESYEETHWRQYLIVQLGGAFPSLTLRPEGLFDKIKALAGFEDINFESEQFSRRYFCHSGDRQFAYALIHPQMMDYLMDLKFTASIENGLMIMEFSRFKYDNEGCQQALSMVSGFVNRIPAFVWQDYGKITAIQMLEPQQTRYDGSASGTISSTAPVKQPGRSTDG